MLDLADSYYGHDLGKILKIAEEKRIREIIALTDEQCDAIRKVSSYYLGKVFEYPAVGEARRGYKNIPTIELLFNAATVLVESLRQPCMKAK